MTLYKRRQLMWLFVAVFFVLGTSTVLYVDGWRLDLARLRITKVGAIFIRSFPKEADIFLDNKPVANKTGILQSGTLVGDLFPKNYALTLKESGYKDWHGSIGVLPSLVTEVKNAVLVPNTAQTVATSVKSFWVKGGEVIVGKENGELVLGGKVVGEGTVVGWTKDLSRILLRGTEGSYISRDLEGSESENVTAYLKRTGAASGAFRVYADEDDKRRLIVTDEPNRVRSAPARIYLFDTERLTVNTLARARRGVFREPPAASQSFIVWANYYAGTSTLTVYDKILEKNRREVELDGETSALKWLDEKNLAILQKNGGLYLYDVGDDKLTKISDGVSRFAFSENKQLFAMAKPSALEALSLSGQDYHKFNLPDAEEIRDIIWYWDSDHVFLVYDNKTVFLDLNDSSLGNLTIAADSGSTEYDPDKNTLYFLDGSDLKALTFPK